MQKFSVVILLCLMLVAGIPVPLSVLWGQLPPTIQRISEKDSAVDLPSAEAWMDSVVPSVMSEFGTACSMKENQFHLDTDATLDGRPLSIAFWAKVENNKVFNIFVAFEEKSSPQHWELYTFAGTGKFSLYLPGNKSGDTISGGPNLADHQWHWLAAVLDKDYAELFVDGNSVAKGRLDRPPYPQPITGKLAVGSLVGGSFPCQGAIDELRIVTGVMPFAKEKIPQRPFVCDDQTLLLSHFDAEQVKALLPVFSGYPLDGKLIESLKVKSFRPSPSLDDLFPTGGTEPTVLPGEKPKRNIPMTVVHREQMSERIKELGLVCVHLDEFREGVFENWGEQYVTLQKELSGETPLPCGANLQLFDEQTLVYPDREQHPIQVVLRRANAMVGRLEEQGPLGDHLWPIVRDLSKLTRLYQEGLPAPSLPQNQRTLEEQRNLDTDYFIASALRRKLMMAYPEFDKLDQIMFLARACYAGSRLTNESNTDRIGGHFATQIYGFNTIAGGGLFVLSHWKEKIPQVTDLLKGKKVVATSVCDRLAGKELDYGSFMAPEVSYDGETIYFSHCGSQEHRWIWTPDTTWNLFKMKINESTVEQLTDSAYNDFDVCELPSGRLVFCSERRGGFIRCFAESARLRVTTSVLHSMKSDGSDIYPISFFETSEWQPSVDRNGMLVYTRWDYTDRENCLGSTYWTCFPDGRNPRSPHGNYPYPWHTFEDNTHGDHRFGNCPDAESALPMTEMQFRAIPESHRYIFTAAPHHGETFGSLCMLDLRVVNDNQMSQVRRLTPYTPFPESESPGRRQYQYGSPWPLSEDVYLCNDWEHLIILDRFGNKELLCEREILPIGYDPRLRLTDPIPLQPRIRPPIIPQQTTQGEDFADGDHQATVGVINVSITDQAFPTDRPVKRLRVLQVIPKPNPWMDVPWIGYATENTPRIPLGTVPVEEDGSVFFEAPAGKQLIFQPLDEEHRAIQTMRAVAFVHPGEKLICIGCHEPVESSLSNETLLPIAFRRLPSPLEPECGPVEPINFYRLIKPIFEERCVDCHRKEKKGPEEMGYEEMRPFVYYYSGSMLGGTLRTGVHGGSRARPGRVGASESKLGKILFDENHRNTVSNEDRHKIILWLDANALRLGAFQNEKEQMEGKLVWPLLDSQ